MPSIGLPFTIVLPSASLESIIQGLHGIDSAIQGALQALQLPNLNLTISPPDLELSGALLAFTLGEMVGAINMASLCFYGSKSTVSLNVL